MYRRDPNDERRDERLAGSTLASFLLHLLAAAFLVSIAAASSQESASESTLGGQLFTVSQQLPAAAQVTTPHPAPPRPTVHLVAPAKRAAMHPFRRPLPVLHELTHVVPSASPNPTPVPPTTPQPLPAPTQAVAAVQPTVAPTARPKAEPTPRPAPTARPQPTARPVPTVAPTTRPAPTARPVPSVAPTHAPTQAPAPVVARTTAPQPTAAAMPHPVPSPVSHQNLPPSNAAGVPSPHPAIAEHPSSGHAAPGKPSASLGRAHVKPRPIAVAPTPSPAPTERPHPAPTRNPYSGLNARLNALLPHGPVVPHEGHYVGTLSLAGRLVPTPPPSVLARTRYIFEGPFGGGDGTLRMWVTSVTRHGPVLICSGWILHFPRTIAQGTLTAPNVPVGPANGIQIGGMHPVYSGLAAGMAPIVVGLGTAECSERALVPFTLPASP
ncbi:MAG: hypothetical protein ACYC8W_07190 [Candidatus Tyrphobacter sp.]